MGTYKMGEPLPVSLSPQEPDLGRGEKLEVGTGIWATTRGSWVNPKFPTQDSQHPGQQW